MSKVLAENQLKALQDLLDKKSQERHDLKAKVRRLAAAQVKAQNQVADLELEIQTLQAQLPLPM